VRSFIRLSHPLTLSISPAIRRLWIAGLLAVLTLLFTSAAPAFAQLAIALVTDPDGVNLRGGPGTEYISLAVIPKGAELPILGAKLNGDWLPVSYQGRMGFVNDEFIEIKTATLTVPLTVPVAASVGTQALAPAPTPAPPPVPQQMRVSSPDGVNLRTGPGTDQRVLLVIPYAARVTLGLRSPDGRWGQVTLNGQSGWVDIQYLSAALDERPVIDTGGGKFAWPVSGRSITTHFGGSHPGVDIDQYPNGGNPVVAVATGKVIFAGGNACCSYGLFVKVEHKDGMMTLYAHLQSIEVREGQDVAIGQSLGRSGNTGYSTGAHLHFEMHLNGAPVDPLSQLPRNAPAPVALPLPAPTSSPVPSSFPTPLPAASAVPLSAAAATFAAATFAPAAFPAPATP